MAALLVLRWGVDDRIAQPSSVRSRHVKCIIRFKSNPRTAILWTIPLHQPFFAWLSRYVHLHVLHLSLLVAGAVFHARSRNGMRTDHG